MMNKERKTLFIAIFTGVLLGIFMVYSAPVDLAESAIPPTPAWSKVGTNDTDVVTYPGFANSTSYDDIFWIITDGSIRAEIIRYDGGLE